MQSEECRVKSREGVNRSIRCKTVGASRREARPGGRLAIAKDFCRFMLTLLYGMNRFINETAINDFEVSMVQSNSSINLSQLEKTLPLAKAEVIKDAGIPTENLNASVKTKNIIKFGVLGLLLGYGISLVRYCALILR